MKTMARCLLALACARVGGALPLEDEKKPIPLYTNDDLQRVAPYRDQTGGSSRLAAPAVEVLAALGCIRGKDY